ncbi:MAG: hypothetical protein ACYDH6_07570 [Acidimicrobiales bacterium]
MRRTRLDDRTADRLFAGAVTPEDAPPGYAAVVGLLRAAMSRPAAAEATREAGTVGSMAAVISEHTPLHHRTRRNTMLSKLLTAKVAALAAVTVLGAGTAAAATGSLPGAAQSTASTMLGDVGISVPGPNAHSAGRAATRGTSDPKDATDAKGAGDVDETTTTVAGGSTTTTTEEGNGPNAHADFGLCTAEAASDGHRSPNAAPTPSAKTCAAVAHPGDAKASDQGDQGQQGKKGEKGSDEGSQGESDEPTTTTAPTPTTTAPTPTTTAPTPTTTSPGSGHDGGSGSHDDHGDSASSGANSTGQSGSGSGGTDSTDHGRP